MAKYHDMITWHSTEVNKLQNAVNETFKERDISPSKYEAWHRSTRAFHAFSSPIDDWLKQIKDTNDLENWQDGREFIFAFFSVDPIYFRSGYTKEELIRRVKKFDLIEPEKMVLRTLIINRIKKGFGRDFRSFCGFIPKITTPNFEKEIRYLAEATDKNVYKRAVIAMRYLPQ